MLSRVLARVHVALWQQCVSRPPILRSGCGSSYFIHASAQNPIAETQNTKSIDDKATIKEYSPEVQDEVRPKFKRGDKAMMHIPWEVGAKYLQSEAFKATYGDKPVWSMYRRNLSGTTVPKRPRPMCMTKDGTLLSGNPCPVCRDDYLVIDYRNVDLLKQFISPYSGDILPVGTLGLCKSSYRTLVVAVHKAKELGLISFDMPSYKYGSNKI